MNSLRTRFIIRRIARNVSTQLQSLATAASSAPASDIQVPVKIDRGPTDILRALESTVSRDPTAPEYKYIDDPYLIPNSLSKKRSYALSREAGKKAAMWIMQEHADILKSDLSEPLIQAYLPPDKYENKDQVSEELLNKIIKKGRVEDALYIYNLLEENVEKETKQALLELLCFYNSQTDQTSEDFPEEKFYQYSRGVKTNTWKNSPVVEKLFEELKNDEKTKAGAYSAMICGTAKYLMIDKAMKLYNYCVDNNIPIALEAYNNVIQLVSMVKDNNEERRVSVYSFLKSMAENGIKPNIKTLNAALYTTTLFKGRGLAAEFAVNLITEFKSIGIKPSLGSYYQLLKIFCRKGTATSNILLEILDELEKSEEIVVQDHEDTSFFVHAMEVASEHMHNVHAGNRLHNLLLTKDNYKLIGGRFNESVYYRHYFHLILTSETIDVFMKVYEDLVPNVYIPEPVIMKDILEMLEVVEKEKATALFPRFLSDILQFDMVTRSFIIKKAFSLMVEHCSPPEGSPLHKQYADWAWTFLKFIEEEKERKLQRSLWPADTYGSIGILSLRANEFDKMLEILGLLVKSQNDLLGQMNHKIFYEMFNACITRGHVPGAMAAIQYAHAQGYNDINTMAQSVKDNLPLSPTQVDQLSSLLLDH